MWAAIVKFFKDFRGTCKKVIWPDRKTVFKSTLVVLATVIVVGAAIWIVDFGLTKGIRGLQDVIANAGAEEESSEEADIVDLDDIAIDEDYAADEDADADVIDEEDIAEVVTSADIPEALTVEEAT